MGAPLRPTEAAVREPLRAALTARAPARMPPGSGTPSAVLVPLFEREGEVFAWMLRRPSTMRRHAGQAAFPGGKHDPTDASLLATALREAHEEIGLLPDDVDVLGQLDDIHTMVSGYVVTPFVGWVRAAYEPVWTAHEVARVFAVPLATFLEDAQDPLPEGFGVPRMLAGLPRFRGWTVDGEFVWGASGIIARALGRIVAALPTISTG